MSEEIIPTIDYLKELEKQYPGFSYDKDTLKPWISMTKKVLFDCGKTEDKRDCLEEALARQDCIEFTVVSITKETGESGETLYSIDESRYKRVGHENLQGFINRFEKTLRESFVLSMQLFAKQQVELIGFSYVSPEEKAQLLKGL